HRVSRQRRIDALGTLRHTMGFAVFCLAAYLAEMSSRRSGRSRRRRARALACVIEALDLAPDFLEDLVANDLLDALSGGVIGVEALRQKALERSIPDVTHVPSADIAAGLGGRFEQLRLRHQGAQLPALPLLLERRRSRVQLLELLHQQLPALPLLLERRRSHAQLLKLLHHLP